jgi:hypothetical protein
VPSRMPTRSRRDGQRATVPSFRHMRGVAVVRFMRQFRKHPDGINLHALGSSRMSCTVARQRGTDTFRGIFGDGGVLRSAMGMLAPLHQTAAKCGAAAAGSPQVAAAVSV